MKRLTMILMAGFIAVFASLGAAAIIYNVFNHGVAYYDWKRRDVSSEKELRLLARIIRNPEFSGTSKWSDEVLLEYDFSRHPTDRSSKFLRENYIFLTTGFVEKKLPVVIPKNDRKGGFVVYSSGLVVWLTRQELDETLANIRSGSIDLTQNAGNE